MPDPKVRAAVTQQVRALPEEPGVYLIRDASETIIYIGKAKRLRARVRSYFGSSRSLEPKVAALAEQTRTIEHIVTRTEGEAFHLEAALVKRHQPMHNVRLKDDKHYPYLKVDVQNEWPRVTITRRIEPDGARYFGPYASAGSVRRTLDVVKKLFPWRSCTKTITGTDPRPCLDYYIKRCIAPCTAFCTPEEYAEVIGQTLLFLEGRSSEVLTQVEADMQRAAEALDFEQAARLRDQADAIRTVTERQQMASTTHMDADVFALAREGDEACVQAFFVRGTVVADTDSFVLNGAAERSDREVLGAFLAQYFEGAAYVPRTLLLSIAPDQQDELLAMLRERRDGAVEIRVPERGELRGLVATAEENARRSLAAHRVRWLTDRDKTEAAMALIQEELDLPAPPLRIECYDISTLQGKHTVASMVVFENGQPAQKQYRRFRIRTVDGQDDFASMHEVLTRRFRALSERRAEASQAGAHQAETAQTDAATAARTDGRPHHLSPGTESGVTEPSTTEGAAIAAASVPVPAPLPNAEPNAEPSAEPSETPEPPAVEADIDAESEPTDDTSAWEIVPDLVVIDGGAGQLSASLDAMRNLGLADIPLCGLAKREEEVYMQDVAEPIRLPRDSEGMYLLQRIRDEAHRFAIQYHRKVRAKHSTRSVLDGVPGIGPKRKRALLRRFGSVQGIRDATAADLAETPGVTPRLAETLKRSL